MEYLKIYGGRKLNGELEMPSSKNAILPILGACLLFRDKVEILNFPNFLDCELLLEMLKGFGIKCKKSENGVILDCSNIFFNSIDKNLSSKLRGSFYLFPTMLRRFGKGEISYPGGCKIGKRPINFSLDAFKQMGVKIELQEFLVIGEKKKERQSNIVLPFPSVSATINVILYACCGSKIVNIYNCAKEPEIVDLVNFLNLSGANIVGAGRDIITIFGINKLLNSVVYKCIGDRIIAGTFLLATCACFGNVKLNNAKFYHLSCVLDVLRLMGASVKTKSNSIEIQVLKRLKNVENVQTNPYPYFPTDLQPQLMALSCVNYGKSTITENVFESRFGSVKEFKKMGAKIVIEKNNAKIYGKRELKGADVYACDLRSGAGLVILGLYAKGETKIFNLHHIDRGYFQIEKDFQTLNAKIIREIQ